jgi:hypothetical protein
MIMDTIYRKDLFPRMIFGGIPHEMPNQLEDITVSQVLVVGN